MSSTALPTAQVNGVVWAQAVSNNVDYVGGSFTQSQPAGAAAGVDVTARSNLLAYDVTTGVALAGFNATTNAQVRGIAASADGSRIYIVGDFTTVDGQPRSHIAALNANGTLVSDFAPSVNGKAYSVAVRGTSVYFGGAFTAVNGATRSRAAAVTTAGVVLPFAPTPNDGVVRAVAISPDATRVLLAGDFTGVGAVADRGMVAVDAASGATEGWGANSLIYNGGTESAIYSLSTRGSVVYATGYVFGTGGDLEGSVAMNWADGSIKWIEDCHGDSYSSVPFNDALYVVSHAHDCSNVVGGWSSPGTPSQWRRAQAFSQSAVGTLARNTEANYADFEGRPSPELVAGWSPTINTGTYTGLDQGAWSASAGGSFLVLGGEFTKVNGIRQTGLVRFQGQPEAADSVTTPVAPVTPPVTPPATGTGTTPVTPVAPPATGTGTTPVAPPVTPPATGAGTTPPTTAVPARVNKPRTAVLGSTRIAAKWSAPNGAAGDKVSNYVIRAYKGSTVVKTVTVGATKRLAVIGGLKRSTTYRVSITAKNATGSSRASVFASARTKTKGKNVSATKVPSKVKKPSTSIGKARLRARWTAASTAGALGVSKYQIRIVLHGRTVKSYTVDDKLRSKLVSGLKRSAAYRVQVRAENWAGWGSWSAAKSSRTH